MVVGSYPEQTRGIAQPPQDERERKELEERATKQVIVLSEWLSKKRDR